MGRLVCASTAAAIAVATVVAPSISALYQSRRLRQHQIVSKLLHVSVDIVHNTNRHDTTECIHKQGVVRTNGIYRESGMRDGIDRSSIKGIKNHEKWREEREEKMRGKKERWK